MKTELVLVLALAIVGMAIAGPGSVLTAPSGQDYISDAVPGTQGAIQPTDVQMPKVQSGTDAITWVTKTEAPSPGRYWAPGTGEVRDTIYICGGRESANAGVNKITGYDVVNDVWVTSGLPTLTTGRRAGAGGQVGSKIVCCGGRSATHVTLNTVEIFDVNAKTVTAGANMPAARWAISGAAVDGKVYIIGDENSTGTTYEYDVAGNTWTTKTACPQGRGWAAAAAAGGKVYVSGGYGGGTQLATCYEFDPVGNTWTQMADMPGTRNYHSMVSYGDTLLYVLGGAASQTADALVYKYHIPSNTWTTETSMPTPHGWHMCSVVGDKIYVQYGSDCSSPTYLTVNEEGQLAPAVPNDVGVMQVIAPAGIIPPGVVAPQGLIKNFGSAAQSDIPVYCTIDSAGTEVYSDNLTHPGPLAAGSTAVVTFANWTGVDGMYDVTMFTDLSGDEDPANDTAVGTVNVAASVWETVPTPTEAPDRVVHATVWDPGTDQVFIIGGNPAGASGTYDGKCQAYDPTAMGWTVKTPMPTPLGWCGYGQVGDKIYMIGGHNNGGGFTGMTQEYDIAGDAWSTKTARPGTAVAAPLSATWNDTLIYIMGGLATSAETRTDIYDPANDAWMTGTPLPAGAYMGSAVCVGDTIYIAQAYNTACWSNLYKGYIDPANPASINWIEGPSMPTPVFNGATVAVGTDIYWIGGFNNAITVTNQVWKYSAGAITQFAPSFPVTLARCTFAAVRENVDGDDIYVMAGDMLGNWSVPNQTYRKINFGGVGVEEQPPVVLRSTIDAVSPSVVRDFARLSYTIGQAGHVRLGVYDVTGTLVRFLVDGNVAPGTRTAVWNCTDGNGRQVSSGTYFFRLTVDGRSFSAKSVVLD